MQMKARDIIPGWPRGRSVAGPRPKIALAGELFFVLLHSSEMIEQARLEDAYHGDQQDMVNAYFESWRLRYPFTVHRSALWYYPWP